MKDKIIVEINGVRHKLIKTRSKSPCETCRLKSMCLANDGLGCTHTSTAMHFIKCKPGE